MRHFLPHVHFRALPPLSRVVESQEVCSCVKPFGQFCAISGVWLPRIVDGWNPAYGALAVICVFLPSACSLKALVSPIHYYRFDVAVMALIEPALG